MNSKEKLKGVQGIRGVVAFLVAYILHYGMLFNALPVKGMLFEVGFCKIGQYGLTFADIFFFMSGFLMYRSNHKKFEPVQLTFKAYIFPKMIKLYPVMIVTATAAFIAERQGFLRLGYWPLHGDNGEIRYSIQSYVLGILGFQSGWVSDGDLMCTNGPSWFLSILLICYVLFYVIMRFVKRRYQILLFWIMVVLGLVLIYYQPNYPLLTTCTGRGYVGFFSGSLIYIYSEGLDEKKKKFVSIGAVLSIFLSIYLVEAGLLDNIELAMVCLFWPAITFLVVYNKWVSSFFGFPIFYWLGEISMSLFLCNVPIDICISFWNLNGNKNLDYSSTTVWICHIIISLVISIISYMIFEKGFAWLYSKVIKQKHKEISK